MCLLDSGRNCVCPCACTCAVCVPYVCARVIFLVYMYMCVCTCGCTRMCGCAASRSMLHRLAEHYLLCGFERARARVRASTRRASSRTSPAILGAAFFWCLPKNGIFSLFRRNKAQAGVARVVASRGKVSKKLWHPKNCARAKPRATTLACTRVRATHIRLLASTLCVSSCAQPKISNQRTELFLVPKMNPEKRR